MEALRRPLARGVDLRHFLALVVGVGLVAGIALPVWFGRAGVTLDAAARLLVRDLRTAQNLAVVEGRTLTITFDRDGYEVSEVAGDPVVHPRTAQPFVRRWSRDAVFRGVRLDGIALDDGGAELEFDRFGYVSPGGRLHLVFDGSQRTIVVEAPRGLIAIDGLSTLDDDDGR